MSILLPPRSIDDDDDASSSSTATVLKAAQKMSGEIVKRTPEEEEEAKSRRELTYLNECDDAQYYNPLLHLSSSIGGRQTLTRPILSTAFKKANSNPKACTDSPCARSLPANV